MYSVTIARDILETAIDSLVDNFVREPYIHRCEHSIHCELYSMLAVHRALQGLHRLGDDVRYSTTLVHKEWPEFKARPGKGDRRGNFDLAILDPESIRTCTLNKFATGRIRPAFVVEMGLNYGLDHLKNDDSKLENSGCSNGYLVHLWQPHKGISEHNIQVLQQWIPKAKASVAAVVFTRSGPMVKRLSDPSLSLVN